MQDIVISLGGSLIVPRDVDVDYLRSFRAFVMQHIYDYRFFIVCGGGSTARKYIGAAEKITAVKYEDRDWLGVHSTRLNAHLMRTIFAGVACPRIIKNPTEKVDVKEQVAIGAGWKPGWSTDYVTVLLAKTFGVGRVINLTDTDYVYDRDPKHNHDAKPLKQIDWKTFCGMVGEEWTPGLNV